MFTAIHGNNFNELAYNTYKTVLGGRTQPSRNGDIYCVNNAILNLKDPASRHLYLEGRNSHIIAQIAETFWVMAGDDRINPFLSFFLPRAKDYSDDGVTWRGAYGPRMYMYNQLQEAVDVFIKQGWETRHSLIQILLPELDSKNNLVDNEGNSIDSTKDRPCNNELTFFMTPNEDGTYGLNMNVFQRSGDAIWGALNINVFEWTFLQELMVDLLEQEMDETVVLGEYTHFVTNLHVYESTASQAVNAVELNEGKTFIQAGTKLTGSYGVNQNKNFFKELVELLTEAIELNEEDYFTSIHAVLFLQLLELFDKYDIKTDGNTLFAYADVTLAHILVKKFDQEDISGACLELTDDMTDLENCLRANKFFKLLK